MDFGLSLSERLPDSLSSQALVPLVLLLRLSVTLFATTLSPHTFKRIVGVAERSRMTNQEQVISIIRRLIGSIYSVAEHIRDQVNISEVSSEVSRCCPRWFNNTDNLAGTNPSRAATAALCQLPRRDRHLRCS